MGDEKNLGADAAAVENAEPVATPQLSHAAPWHVQGSVVKCDVGGFKMVWSASGGPPVAYVAALDDAHLIAAAPELLREVQALMDFVHAKRGACWSGTDTDRVKAVIAKAEGRSR